MTERVGDLVFRQNAGSFFQNNSSILPSLLAYVEAQLRPSDKYLVDAYCGSGLFGVALSKRVERVTGIEISAESIKYAKDNARDNGATNCTFRAGQAERIFDGLDFPPDETTVVIDPPRKGCDDLFLDQLAAFRPASIVYVSCNGPSSSSSSRSATHGLDSALASPRRRQALGALHARVAPRSRPLPSISPLRVHRRPASQSLTPARNASLVVVVVHVDPRRLDDLLNHL